ncbi:hypothetical protein HID58_017788 [Brassica napus]|uniref:Uncharacterized protein n=1 Tax=Brassica napus TaxID=3708 RepID=A0ABQ8D856_BRANA|nr:hypothetical protein HID58_017788 [Brassica napus]
MFNSKPMVKKKQGMVEAVDDPDLSFSKIMKDVQLFASSLHMTWKDKKALENQKVTGLGGKVRFLLSFGSLICSSQSCNFYDLADPFFFVDIVASKETEATPQCSASTDEETERKRRKDNVIFGQFGGTSRKKPAADKKRKPEERVLKSTFGNFRGGVLDVKDLLRSGGSSRTNDRDNKNKSKGMGGELGGGGRDIKKNRKKKAKKGGGKRKSK